MPADDRRAQLLGAALQIALADDFHAVTVDGVAKAAGVTRPVVYALFADRHEILAELLVAAEGRALAQLGVALPGVPGPEAYVDPDAILADAVTAYLSVVRDDPDTWRVVLLSPDGAPVELAQRVAAVRREVLRPLRVLVEWAIDRRGGAALDSELFTRAVLTLAEGAARLHLAHPDDYPVERFRAFTEDLLAGLLRA
jgi:AcrR family transcriptional regulator